MAAPNTLIINNRTIVDAGFNLSVVNGSFSNLVSVGNTSIADIGISTKALIANTLQLNNTLYVATNAQIVGALGAGSLSTTGTLSAGATTFNSTVTIGSVALQNGQVKVSNSIINNDSISSPNGSFSVLNASGTTSTNANITNLTVTGQTLFNGLIMRNNGSILWRNSANNQNILQVNVSTENLFYINAFNNDGSFKSTILRYSVGSGTSDPSMSVGPATIFNAGITTSNIQLNGSIVGTGNANFSGSVVVNGNISAGAALYANAMEIRSDCRVTRQVQGDATQGMLYFGNADKRVWWDGGNWVMRGGALYTSGHVNEGHMTINNGGTLFATGDVDIGKNMAVSGFARVGQLVSQSLITSGYARIQGWGANDGGLIYFGTGNQRHLTCDGNNYAFNGGSLYVDGGFVRSNSFYAAGGNLHTHHNNATGTLYFGNNSNSWIDYNGAGLITVPHDFKTNGSLTAVNVNIFGGFNGDTVAANQISSRGNLSAAGNVTGSGLYGNFIESNGNINAKADLTTNSNIHGVHFRCRGNMWSGEGIYHFGQDYRANISIDGGTTLYSSANFFARQSLLANQDISCKGSLFTGPNFVEMRIFADANKDGYIYTQSQRLYLENMYAWQMNNRSDVRLKDIREGYPDNSTALDTILALEPIKYTWKADSGGDSSVMHYGFKAQQVQELIPEIVQEAGGVLHIAQLEMMPFLVSSIKELKRELEDLRNELTLAKKSPPRKKRA